MPLYADYHNHPQAHRTDLAYRPEVLDPWGHKALETGVKDVALTDHDRYKEGIHLEEVDALNERFPDVTFRKGIELDNDPETSLSGHKWVEKNYDNLDFVLGSVHFVYDFPFDHPAHKAEYDNYDINDLVREYYKNIRTIASNGLVDSMAHLDLIKIFKFFPTESMDEVYEETLELIKEKDLSIEISAAGLVKPIGEIYPHPSIIQKAKAKGISFTIASDAHAPQNLNWHYDKLEELLKTEGIEEIAIYEKHQKKLVPAFV